MSSGTVTSWGSGLPSSWLGIQLQSRRQAATWIITGILLPAPYPLLFALLPGPSPAPHLCPWKKLFSTKFVPKKLGTAALVDNPFPYLCQLLEAPIFLGLWPCTALTFAPIFIFSPPDPPAFFLSWSLWLYWTHSDGSGSLPHLNILNLVLASAAHIPKLELYRD